MKKKQIMINGDKLYVARVRIVLNYNELTGERETAHYNQLGYRLLLKKNEHSYLDILTNKTYKTLSDDTKAHQLFVLDPKPFYFYAYNVRVKENYEDVIDYAKFVSDYFNKRLHYEESWIEAKNFVHKAHHKDEQTTK